MLLFLSFTNLFGFGFTLNPNTIFSKTIICLNKAWCWNTNPIPLSPICLFITFSLLKVFHQHHFHQYLLILQWFLKVVFSLQMVLKELIIHHQQYLNLYFLKATKFPKYFVKFFFLLLFSFYNLFLFFCFYFSNSFVLFPLKIF